MHRPGGREPPNLAGCTFMAGLPVPHAGRPWCFLPAALRPYPPAGRSGARGPAGAEIHPSRGNQLSLAAWPPRSRPFLFFFIRFGGFYPSQLSPCFPRLVTTGAGLNSCPGDSILEARGAATFQAPSTAPAAGWRLGSAPPGAEGAQTGAGELGLGVSGRGRADGVLRSSQSPAGM